MFVQNLIDCRDAAVGGGKGANLGQLIRLGANTPAGFVVTANAYRAAAWGAAREGGARESAPKSPAKSSKRIMRLGAGQSRFDPPVEGGSKRRRGGRVAAVQFGGAHECSPVRRQDGEPFPDLTPLLRKALECDPTWSSGETFAGRC